MGKMDTTTSDRIIDLIRRVIVDQTNREEVAPYIRLELHEIATEVARLETKADKVEGLEDDLAWKGIRKKLNLQLDKDREKHNARHKTNPQRQD